MKYDYIRRKVVNYFYDHRGQEIFLEYLKNSIMTALSAFVFCFGFATFINPNFIAIAEIIGPEVNNVSIHQLASCGSSGLAQSIIIILKYLNFDILVDSYYSNVIYWGIYLLINIPLLIFAFIKIGKRFSIFTLLNVVLVVTFGILLKSDDPNNFINQVAAIFYDQPLTRILIAGICSGVSSALAYIIESCAGGADVISYYIGEKKQKLVGKYTVIINFFIIILFSLLSTLDLDPKYETVPVELYTAFAIFVYTILYMAVSGYTVDKINIQNAKIQVQIITEKKDLSDSLIAALPHGCTIFEGKGGYTKNKKYMIIIAARKKELSQIKRICYEEDKKAFIDVIVLSNLMGKFYRRRIK